MIRATTDDVPFLCVAGERFHAAQKLPGRYNALTFSRYAEHLIGHGVVFRTEIGMIGGSIRSMPWDSTYRSAQESFWWSEDRQGMALLAAFEGWAQEQGADEVRMAFLHGHKAHAVIRKLSGAGYQSEETGMVKRWS